MSPLSHRLKTRVTRMTKSRRQAVRGRLFGTLLTVLMLLGLVGTGSSPYIDAAPTAPDPASPISNLQSFDRVPQTPNPREGSQGRSPISNLPAVTIAADSPPPLRPTASTVLKSLRRTTADDDFAYDPTSVYDQKGLSAPRGFSAQAPNEMVDPFSGNLIIRHTDLHLPGIAGLDLTLQRVYNSKIHRNYAKKTSDPNGLLFVPPSPVGLGWTMHLGRLVGAVSTGPNNTLAGPRYYERSDGSQHPFFTYSGPGCDAGSGDVCLLTKQMDNPYWDGTDWRLATADGRNITFGHEASDGSTVVHYATEIRDIHGNRIQISYHDNTISGISVQRDYFRHFIDYIIDSAGRRIDFNYGVVNSPDVVRLTSITFVGRTYQYFYSNTNPWPSSQAFLTRAQPPEGAPWRYEYQGLSNGDCADNSKRWCELTEITYPAGGTIEYTFDELTFWTHGNPAAVRAVATRTIGGREVTSAAWTYQYNRANNYSGDEHTVITRPGGSQEIYTYFGAVGILEFREHPVERGGELAHLIGRPFIIDPLVEITFGTDGLSRLRDAVDGL